MSEASADETESAPHTFLLILTESHLSPTARYTLKSEIERMKYSITTVENTILATAAEIHGHFGDGVDDDIFAYFGLNDENSHDLLWRASNQSLLGDIVALLSGPEDIIRPHLGASGAANKVAFEINFNANFVNVVGSFNVVIGDLQIALFTVSIYLNFDDSELRCTLEDLRPVLVTDESLKIASEKIANDKFACGELDDLKELERGSHGDSIAAIRDVIQTTKHLTHSIKSTINNVDQDELRYKTIETATATNEGFKSALNMLGEATGIGKTAEAVGGGVGAVAGGLWGGLRGLGTAIRTGAEQIEASMNEEVARIEAEEKWAAAHPDEVKKPAATAAVIGEPPSPALKLYRRDGDDNVDANDAGDVMTAPDEPVIKLRSLFGGVASGLVTGLKTFSDKVEHMAAEIDESVNNTEDSQALSEALAEKEDVVEVDIEEDGEEDGGEEEICFVEEAQTTSENESREDTSPAAATATTATTATSTTAATITATTATAEAEDTSTPPATETSTTETEKATRTRWKRNS